MLPLKPTLQRSPPGAAPGRQGRCRVAAQPGSDGVFPSLWCHILIWGPSLFKLEPCRMPSTQRAAAGRERAARPSPAAPSITAPRVPQSSARGKHLFGVRWGLSRTPRLPGWAQAAPRGRTAPAKHPRGTPSIPARSSAAAGELVPPNPPREGPIRSSAMCCWHRLPPPGGLPAPPAAKGLSLPPGVWLLR